MLCKLLTTIQKIIIPFIVIVCIMFSYFSNISFLFMWLNISASPKYTCIILLFIELSICLSGTGWEIPSPPCSSVFLFNFFRSQFIFKSYSFLKSIPKPSSSRRIIISYPKMYFIWKNIAMAVVGLMLIPDLQSNELACYRFMMLEDMRLTDQRKRT